MAKEYIRETRVLGNIRQFGNILLFDSGQNGMVWTVAGDVANPKAVISDYRTLNYGTKLKLFNNNASAVDAKFIEISKPFPSSNSDMYFLRGIFQVLATANVESFRFMIRVTDGAKRYTVGIKLDVTNSRLKYFNDAGTYTNVVGTNVLVLNEMWNYIEFSFNKITEKYGRLIFNDTEYDLSAIDVYSVADVGAAYGISDIYVYQEGTTANFEFYLDSVLITGDR